MKSIFKLILALFLFAAVLATSEFIYTVHNRPRLVGAYYILRAQISADNNLQKSLEFIIHGSRKTQKANPKDNNPYPEEFLISTINTKIDDKLANDLKGYIKNNKLTTLYEQEFYDYPRILYDLSLIAQKHDNSELFVLLMKHTTATDIGMSYWAVELANYYFSIGNKEAALNILANCEKIEKTKDHCKQIRASLDTENISFNVGFMKEATENIYNPQGIKY